MKTQLIFKYIGIGIIAMLLAMCDAGGNTGDTGRDTTIDISTYTFSYEATPHGTAATLSPTWNEDISNVTYAIGGWVDNTETNKATIDASTGEVTIATDTIAGSYTITATGSGGYSGTATAKVYVTVAPAPDPSADPSSTDSAEKDRATGKAALTTAINAGITAWGNEGDFNYIITTTVTDMSGLFQDDNIFDSTEQLFNGDIRKWNTSKVTSMYKMFYKATAFNQPIGDWNTSAVTNMDSMFLQATAFNQPIGDWKTGTVQNMSSMFDNAVAFNQSIGDWDTSAVQNMNWMFFQATLFNQDINNWNVGAVETGKSSLMFTKSGMASIPCWYDSTADSGNGAIRDPRPSTGCTVAN